jgi:hypothetical protein
MNQQIDKPDYNEEYRICDFSPVFVGTETIISTPTVTIYDSVGLDVSATMVSNVSISTDTKGVRYMLKGGAKGSNYEMDIKITTSGGQKFKESFTVCVF